MSTQPPTQDPNPNTTPPDMKARLKASYDAIAPTYNTWTVPHTTSRLLYLSKLLTHLPTTSATSILELGCGNGVPVTQTLLSNPHTNVIANDLSTSQIELARQNLVAHAERLKLVEGDMLALDIELGTLDAVVAFYSIIHLPRTEQVELLRKIKTWLKPGGWVLANFGAEDEPGRNIEGWLGEKEGWMFWSGWGAEGTLGMLGDVGLKVEEYEVLDDVVDGARFLWVLARKGV